MTRSFVSAPHYLQAIGAVDELATHVDRLGSHALLIADETVQDVVEDPVERSFERAESSFATRPVSNSPLRRRSRPGVLGDWRGTELGVVPATAGRSGKHWTEWCATIHHTFVVGPHPVHQKQRHIEGSR